MMGFKVAPQLAGKPPTLTQEIHQTASMAEHRCERQFSTRLSQASGTLDDLLAYRTELLVTQSEANSIFSALTMSSESVRVAR